MGLFRREKEIDDRPATRDEVVTTDRDTTVEDDAGADRPGYVTERRGFGAGRSMIRALFTLAGVAVAGLLIWIASNLDLGQTGEFWAAMGLIAGAGLTLGLSQLFGGWTKWGWPRLSPIVLLIGFLPALILGGWILLTVQPEGGSQQGRFEGWSNDLGVLGFVQDIGLFPAAIAMGLGIVLAFVFDTTGPRERMVERDRSVPDEDIHDYRRESTVESVEPVGRSETVPRTDDAAGRSEPVPAGAREERVEIRDPNRRDTP